jgi:hypothetical protein
VITGRKKDIIIRSGENISPKEVEDVLATHPGVADVAIVAMPSRETGEKGCAFVVLRPEQAIDLAEIRRFLNRAGLARQKFPEHLVIVDELPRVPSGKVSKDVLRARAKAIAEAGGPLGARKTLREHPGRVLRAGAGDRVGRPPSGDLRPHPGAALERVEQGPAVAPDRRAVDQHVPHAVGSSAVKRSASAGKSRTRRSGPGPTVSGSNTHTSAQ